MGAGREVNSLATSSSTCSACESGPLRSALTPPPLATSSTFTLSSPRSANRFLMLPNTWSARPLLGSSRMENHAVLVHSYPPLFGPLRAIFPRARSIAISPSCSGGRACNFVWPRPLHHLIAMIRLRAPGVKRLQSAYPLQTGDLTIPGRGIIITFNLLHMIDGA